MDNEHNQQLMKLRFAICPFVREEILIKGIINLTYRREMIPLLKENVNKWGSLTIS